MNLILFDRSELTGADSLIKLPIGDPRAVHLLTILRASTGSIFDAGIINGEIGRAEIFRTGGEFLDIRFTPQGPVPGLHPVILLLGLSRPPTVRKILKEATALGVERFVLCGTETGEKSYRQSSLLQPEKIREVLLEGAQQAVCTMLPRVDIEHSLRCAVESLDGENTDRRCLALDNYEAEDSLTGYWSSGEGVQGSETGIETVLAVGSERGWTDKERRRLKDADFRLLSIGPRVLRTETAAIAGLALCLSGMKLI